MKTRWIAAAAVILIVAGFVAWQQLQPDARVECIRPEMATIRVYVEEQATTELPRDYLLAMPIAGWLEPISLREGDTVEKGEIVACLDKADLRDRVVQAEQRIAVLETDIRKESDHRLENNLLIEAEATVKAMEETVQAAEKQVEASKALADFAKSEVERIRAIRQVNAASDREFREAETEWRRANAEHQSDALELAALKTIAAVSYIGPKFIHDYVDRKTFNLESYERQLAEAKAALEIQKRNLARADIESPIDGVVLQRHQWRRQFLAAGTPLLTVGQLDEMEVIAEVLTERAPHIEPGDPVDIYGEAILDGPIRGRISRVYPAGFKKISSLGVEQQRVNVAVRLDRRPPGLGVGFRVYVRIYYDEAADVLTLPRPALFRDSKGRWQAIVVREGITQLAPVTCGIMNDDHAQIIDGLKPDDLVVAAPSREIVPGMRVEVTTTASLD